MNAIKEFAKRWPFDRAPVILGVTCALALIALVAWLGLPAWVLPVVALPAGSWGVFELVQYARAERELDAFTQKVQAVCEAAEREPQPDTILVHDPIAAAKLHELNDAHAKGDTARVEALGAEALALHFGGHASMEEWIDGALNAGSGFPDE